MYNRHHRLPRSLGGSDHPRNVIIVNKYLHESWHHLFYNMTAHQIAEAINNVWLDPDFVFVVKRRTSNAQPSDVLRLVR